MKEFNWKDAIYCLNCLFQNEDDVKDCLVAKEHIEGLIQCINDLHDEGKDLQQEYEEASIESWRVKEKFKDYRRRQSDDIEETLTMAKRSNKKIHKKILNDFRTVQQDLKITEQSTEDFSKQNVSLIDVSKGSREETGEMSRRVGDAITNTSNARIMLTNTKIEAHTTYEQAVKRCEDIEQMGFETLEYFNVSQTDFDDVEEETEDMKGQIKEQDEKVAEAKHEVQELGHEVYSHQIRNHEAIEILDMEEEELEILMKEKEKLLEVLEKKQDIRDHHKTIYEYLIKGFDAEKHQLQKELEEQTNKLKDVRRGIVELKILRERLIVDQEFLVANATNRRNNMFTVNAEMKLEKQDIRTANNVIAEIWGDMARMKKETTMLHEYLFIAADRRETMEKLYAKRLRQIRNDLVNEMHLRQKVERENILLEKFYEQYYASELPFEVNGELQDNLEKEKKNVHTSISEKETVRKKIKMTTKKQITKFEKKKTKIVTETKVIQTRVDRANEIVHELTETKDDWEEKVSHLQQRADSTEKECTNMIKSSHQMKQDGSDIKHNMVVVELEKEALKIEENDLKEGLDYVHLGLQEQLIRMQEETYEINSKIFKLMFYLQQLMAANKTLREGCDRERSSNKMEQKELNIVGENIMQCSKIINSYRVIFRELADAKSILTMQTNHQLMTALQAVGGIKNNSEQRLAQVSETARQMEALIESCIFISEPSRPIGSDTHLKKMEELKRRRTEISRRNTSL